MNQRGLSLIELMISLTLGSLIVLAALTLLGTQSQQMRDQTEKTFLQESSRVTLDVLGNHIRLAGFFGTMDNGDPIVPAGTPALLHPRCQNLVTDPTALGLQVSRFATTGAVVTAYDCIPPQNIDIASPVLEVRSVDGVPVPPNNASAPLPNTEFFVQASPGGGTLFFGDNGYQALVANFQDRVYADGTTPVEVMRWMPAIYYVRPCARPTGLEPQLGVGNVCQAGDDPTPTLVRQRLRVVGTTPTFVEESLVEGVERVSYQIGLANNDGDLIGYFDPDDVADWGRAVSVRVIAVIRKVGSQAGAVDTRTFNLGLSQTFSCSDISAAACNFDRDLFTGTFNIRNRLL